MMAAAPASAAPHERSAQNVEGLKVINAGLFRMGTKSMAQAYKILGFNVHHGLLEDMTETLWSLIEEAAEATWPTVPGARPRPPRTRADWDRIWGARYDVVSDLASPFALELIRAYPDAKVVVVQRDFDAWLPSFTAHIRDIVMKEPQSSIMAFLTSSLMGIRPFHAMRKVLLGFFGASSRGNIDAARVRAAYDAYFRAVREAVPAGRRLEYKLGSGWEPLCAFLGVPVPPAYVPFPRVNEDVALQAEVQGRRVQVAVGALRVSAPWVLAAAAVGVGI